MTELIRVRSHVSRDLLQTAAAFADVPRAVWEYIANGLEYVDPNMAPRVMVKIDKRLGCITIEDNGRGMSREGLQNYFILHGENQDRASGRPGRGRFGTGKSAAFGIGETLKVTTVRNKVLNSVELNKTDIIKQIAGDEIPVRDRAKDSPAEMGNGTKVEIEGITRSSIDISAVRQFVQRQLRSWSRGSRVFVNDEECVVQTPPTVREFRFSSNDDAILGNVELVIFRSQKYLEKPEAVIDITCCGVLHESYAVKDHNYIFGSIDVPEIENDAGPIPAIDATRSLRLNRNNTLVQALLRFVDVHLSAVCKELKEEECSRNRTENANKLKTWASRISNLLNQHYRELRNRPRRSLPRSQHGIPQNVVVDGTVNCNRLVPGGDIPAVLARNYRAPAMHNGTNAPGQNAVVGAGNQNKIVFSQDGDRVGEIQPGSDDSRIEVQGFQVEYENLGITARRSRCDLDNRKIIINIDHPQISRNGEVAFDDHFQRAGKEIVITEYAMALCSESVYEGLIQEPFIAIEEIAETIDLLSRKSLE